MVSIDYRDALRYASTCKLLKRGAESEIRLCKFMGLDSVFKLRLRKPYMHPRLDSMLRSLRTRREARVIRDAIEGGVSAPLLYAVFPSIGLIVMEYIRGPRLKDVIDEGVDRVEEHAWEAGRQLGLLHRAGIVHGDPTTSNYIVGERLVLIDYGLAEYTTSIEERAVDLHLFRRAVESTHARLAPTLYNAFLEGYRTVMGGEAYRVEERADEIRLRGRYVEERRRSVWSGVADST